MSENTRGGAQAADIIDGVAYPRIKVGHGANNSYTDVSAESPLPVEIVGGGDDSGGLTDAELRASAVPVSVSGVATAAKQPALGTAGTASADVISIQGVASGTVVPVGDGGGSLTVDGTVSVSGLVPGVAATSLGKAEDAVAGDGDTGVMALTVRKDTAATTVGAEGDYAPLLTDGNGKLYTNATISAALPAGTALIGKTGIDQTTPGTTNAVAPISGQAGVAGGAGAVAATVQRMTLASDDPAVATLGATTGAAIITDADGTIQRYLRGLVKLAITAGSFLVTATIAAGTALMGKVSAGIDTATIYNGTTALTPKFAFANIAASQTASSVVALVSAKKIRVLSLRIHAGGTATNVTFNSASAAISELFACPANGGHHLAFSPVGHFETVAGEALTVTTGAGATTGIGLTYVEV